MGATTAWWEHHHGETWNVAGVASASHGNTRAVFEQLASPIAQSFPPAKMVSRILLMWAVAGDDDTNLVLEWLGERVQGLQEEVPFHGGQTEPSQTLRLGWVALREVFRNWGVRAREDLTNWLVTHWHPRSSPGSCLTARSKEFILSAACGSGARVALSEAVCGLIQCQECS